MFISKSFSLNSSFKTTFWITSSFLTVFDIIHPSSATIISQSCVRAYLGIFSVVAYFSATVLILFLHCVSINFFFWAPFLWFFSRLFLLINCIFSREQLNHLCHFPSCFWVTISCTFVDAVNLVTMSNLKHKLCCRSHTSQIPTWKHLLRSLFQCFQSN